MKTYYYIIAVILLLTACSKNDDGASELDINHNSKYTLTAGINKLSMSNLQVDDLLGCNIKIENFDGSENVVYVLKPVIGSQLKHQVNKLDYNFIEKTGPVEVVTFSGTKSVYSYGTRDSIVITSANSDFYLEILKPGTFELSFTLQKMIKQSYVSDISEESLLFNAVKINAWTFYRETRDSGLFNHSEKTRYYRFNIDDGEQDYDKYLTNENGISHTYSVTYGDDSEYKNNFVVSEELLFKDDKTTESSAPAISNFIIENLKITQTFSNSPSNIIDYKNIKIENRDGL
ncbi:hypothetical protein M4I21_18095 [Cellulophaga sp. 20_2_10]|uniref:hypothetical protein n=1 Tax=Cellulophaga sp. 20_2_10 TaxID=2942476 RepID=UPI00201AF838|nr:hypothetical protein [Cellulophaga sp. 20_2_10]MCL5247730.1 hypothetical protein [Cellulophaga sp. 20_2_10]